MVENGNLRILLIEDDPEDALIVQKTLADSGKQNLLFEFAGTLEEGIKILRSKPIDIILLDLLLPDSDGLNSLTSFMHDAGNVPVVVLTSLNDEIAALKAVHDGAQDYLIKDELSSHHLVRTLQHAFERHQVRNELHHLTEELKEKNVALETMALIDPLTELMNRRGFHEALSRELAHMRRDAGQLIAILVDVDNFKTINDSLGYQVGDSVLREIAGKIKSCLREIDCVARLGGDEFMVLLPRTRDVAGMQVAEKIRQAISGIQASYQEKSISVSASLGVIAVPRDTSSLDTLLEKAHGALKISKVMGKNRVSTPTEGPKFREAIQSKSIEKHHYMLKQPIVELADQTPVAFELFSRLTQPGFEFPSLFFRMAYEHKSLSELDFGCFKRCLKASELEPTLRCHINLFPSTLVELGAQKIIDGIPFSGRPGGLCLEISEGQIIGELSDISDQIKLLKQSGILIAIDDVGFNRGNLESLILFEPDIIKIDRRYISGCGDDSAKWRPLERLQRIAETLRAATIVEGIEVEGEYNTLKNMGFLFGQGFYFSDLEKVTLT